MIIKIKYIELKCFDDRNNDYVKDSDVSEVVLIIKFLARIR